MFTTIVVLGLVLIVSLWAFSYWCVYRAGKENGYDEAHAEHEAAKVAERRAERRKTGRHAAVQPRTSLVVPKPSPLPWYPLPGPGKPQAGRDSGAGTETMDRLTTTGELAFGELRANAFIASLVADEEAHRLESAT